MTEQERAEAMRAWLASRPESVQKLAAEFPAHTAVQVKGENYYVFGYTEKDMLILFPSESVDYDDAYARREYLCADHLRHE